MQRFEGVRGRALFWLRKKQYANRKMYLLGLKLNFFFHILSFGLKLYYKTRVSSDGIQAIVTFFTRFIQVIRFLTIRLNLTKVELQFFMKTQIRYITNSQLGQIFLNLRIKEKTDRTRLWQVAMKHVGPHSELSGLFFSVSYQSAFQS